jgi:hypothetical protein
LPARDSRKRGADGGKLQVLTAHKRGPVVSVCAIDPSRVARVNLRDSAAAAWNAQAQVLNYK